MKTIAVLTSSRADYGVYLPLLRKMNAASEFDLRLIAFGTHTSNYHGFTVNVIKNDGFKIDYSIENMLLGDTEEAISSAIALTQMKFASIWANEKHNYDFIISLGDRYEMFAAVSAAVPFNMKIAHLFGGEETLGAIDNVFRHAISIFSKYHFTSTSEYAKRVSQIIGRTDHIYNVGALSLDNLTEIPLLNIEEFKQKYHIDLCIPTILVTFHPETIAVDKNVEYVNELIASLESLNMQTIITMPNADTMGSIMRVQYETFTKKNTKCICVENLGTQGYFSCMKNCAFLLGNTSSGIIEAASFGKYVINIGDRQNGRLKGKNVIDCLPERNQILNAVKQIQCSSQLDGTNIYWNGGASEKILNILKKILI